MTQERWSLATEELVRGVLERWVSLSSTYYPAGFYDGDADNATEAILEALADVGIPLLSDSSSSSIEWGVRYQHSRDEGPSKSRIELARDEGHADSLVRYYDSHPRFDINATKVCRTIGSWQAPARLDTPT